MGTDMTQEQSNDVMQRYLAFTDGLDFSQRFDRIEAMDANDPDKYGFWDCFVNHFFDMLTMGYLWYDRKKPDEKIVSLIKRMQKYAPSPFIAAFLAMIRRDKKGCLGQLEQVLTPDPDSNELFTDVDFSMLVLEPFKNAFPGFYEQVRKMLDKLPTEDSAKALCEVLDAFYAADSADDRIGILLPVMQKYPDSVITASLLGFTYFQAKRWGNAIACFERAEDKGFTRPFFASDVQLYKGVAYSRLRERENAVKSFEHALELEPNTPNALNNLGYEYYLMKRYPKALEIFRRCLDEKRDLPYAANNYVRTLLAMKRYGEAKKFVKHPPCTISSSILRKVNEADGTDQDIPEPVEMDEEDAPVSDAAAEKLSPGKGAQFSSEKVLEDELTARIEAGVPVFGKRLKIYRRHGEYGRQYIIPIGRLDLLAEDDEGNLYIIELKKDSGYDDAYAQTAAYLDWFEAHRKPKGRVYGIICLSQPTEKLKAAVRKDKRVRLFNYRIVYEEVE